LLWVMLYIIVTIAVSLNMLHLLVKAVFVILVELNILKTVLNPFLLSLFVVLIDILFSLSLQNFESSLSGIVPCYIFYLRLVLIPFLIISLSLISQRILSLALFQLYIPSDVT